MLHFYLMKIYANIIFSILICIEYFFYHFRMEGKGVVTWVELGDVTLCCQLILTIFYFEYMNKLILLPAKGAFVNCVAAFGFNRPPPSSLLVSTH